jgi:hypothetical protein
VPSAAMSQTHQQTMKDDGKWLKSTKKCNVCFTTTTYATILITPKTCQVTCVVACAIAIVTFTISLITCLVTLPT